MKKSLMFVLSILMGMSMVTACNSANGTAAPTPVPSSTPLAAAEKNLFPTPISTGKMIVHDNLQVEMKEAEITSTFITEYGSTREPPPGKNIIWIHILLKNIGEHEQTLPEPEHFSVLNSSTEFKPVYGHRKDHTDYMTLTPILAQGQEVDAWLRFDIPVAMDLKEFMFAFLPDSSQISIDLPASDYLWADHPTYLWTCAP